MKYSKTTPTTKEKQRKNNILEEVIASRKAKQEILKVAFAASPARSREASGGARMQIAKLRWQFRLSVLSKFIAEHYLTWHSLKLEEISFAISPRNSFEKGVTFSNSGSIVFSALKF